MERKRYGVDKFVHCSIPLITWQTSLRNIVNVFQQLHLLFIRL